MGLATQAQQQNKNQNNPRLIQANSSDNFTLYHVDLLNSPNFHVVYNGGTGFTAWGVRIRTPATARNTDGIDPAGATNVTINDSYIMTGDDGVAIKGGGAASRNITVENSHFYGTHGISIGSETNSGVSNVLVRDNTVTGTDALGNASVSSVGIRIKSSPATAGRSATSATWTPASPWSRPRWCSTPTTPAAPAPTRRTSPGSWWTGSAPRPPPPVPGPPSQDSVPAIRWV
ncbi:glycosyl hydrolase family 28 protein [Streptacidiphilus monticola]